MPILLADSGEMIMNRFLAFVGVNKDLRVWLKTKDLAYTWREIPGGHSFMVWRRFLGEFLPLIFQTP